MTRVRQLLVFSSLKGVSDGYLMRETGNFDTIESPPPFHCLFYDPLVRGVEIPARLSFSSVTHRHRCPRRAVVRLETDWISHCYSSNVVSSSAQDCRHNN